MLANAGYILSEGLGGGYGSIGIVGGGIGYGRGYGGNKGYGGYAVKDYYVS